MRKKLSGWTGAIPPEIVACGDKWIVDRFKKLCAEAQDVLYMQKGATRTKKEEDLNKRLKDLIYEAKRRGNG